MPRAFAADAAFDGYDARSAAAEKPRTLRISLGTEFAVHLVQARFLSFGQTTQDRCCGLRVNVEAWMGGERNDLTKIEDVNGGL